MCSVITPWFGRNWFCYSEGLKSFKWKTSQKWKARWMKTILGLGRFSSSIRSQFSTLFTVSKHSPVRFHPKAIKWASEVLSISRTLPQQAAYAAARGWLLSEKMHLSPGSFKGGPSRVFRTTEGCSCRRTHGTRGMDNVEAAQAAWEPCIIYLQGNVCKYGKHTYFLHGIYAYIYIYISTYIYIKCALCNALWMVCDALLKRVLKQSMSNTTSFQSFVSEP